MRFRIGIARQHGGPVPAQQVAFFWAKKLGGDAGVKLLNKLGHAEQALELACEQHAYEFAFDIARLLLKDRLPEVHYKYALHLEDERRYADAEAEFLKAKRPRDAVLMYVQIKDWDRGNKKKQTKGELKLRFIYLAQRIAQANDKALLNDVLIGQAKQAFDNNDFQKAESFLLQAQRPDLAVKLYKDNGKPYSLNEYSVEFLLFQVYIRTHYVSVKNTCRINSMNYVMNLLVVAAAAVCTSL